ncbi:STN domain-containing protein [Sandaracinobacter sp. RS1-74]|uniref:STN domain-containing protein n=1 Tax=Sandaracinobacteroides sayramensis TaxID=2913411 RepID=UPI001EDA89D9|nr:STN domain-containing protein [Sandaracinobacteroides sayramensis]MCG2841830.1 STN domain-containing protein [Sandaracinobacteroides sayramensis]
MSARGASIDHGRPVAAPRPVSAPRRRLPAIVAPFLALLFIAPAAANDDGSPADVQRYDIPAQQLGSALSRYTATSGVDFVLDERQSEGRQSSEVIGTYTPPQALHILLQGTGLVARFTSRKSAVIMPVARAHDPLPPAPNTGGIGAGNVVMLDMMRVTAPRLIGSEDPSANLRFVQRVAATIHAAILDAGLAERGAGASLRIQTRISEDGTLHDVRIARASADPKRDASIVALLEGKRLDLVPPARMRQPLLFDVAGR